MKRVDREFRTPLQWEESGGSKSALVTRWHRFPRNNGNPWKRERISPGHVISSIKRRGSLTFWQRWRIVPLLPPLPLAGSRIGHRIVPTQLTTP